MLLILLIICLNGVNATDISDNSTIGDQSPTIYVGSSYDGDVGSGTQSNPYEIVSSAVGTAAGEETLYVSPTGDDNNSGTRDSPLATLSHAINITETGNIVLLEGIHNVNGLNTDKTLIISGEGNATIDASKSSRILYVYEGGDVSISNVEMINGYSSESGALIGNAGKLTLINTTLSDSISNNNGGAVYNVGTLTIINSIFMSNTANLGGAIYSGSSIKTEINIRIVNTTFSDNTALGNANNKGGGAIYAQASSGMFILENVTFENNKAGKYGGGALYAMQLDNIKISDSKFINNSAEVNEYYGGGAIAVIGGNYQREGTTTITNTLFENNNADMSGGAIFLKGTTLDISNSVLVNSADANGIVIYSAPTVNSVNSKITANDNWWGSNDNPKKLITKVSTVTLNRWAILTIENDTEIVQGNDVNIVVSLCNYTTGSVNGTLSKPITVKRNVSLQTSFEEFDGILDNGIYNITYTVPAGLKLISATVDAQSVVLYVVESEASINLGDVAGKKGSKVNITAQILTSDSLSVNDGYINFYVGSKLIGHVNVLNNNATLIYLIKEDEGIYNLTAEYVSESGAFSASNATAMLNVSGLNNIVREDKFYEFFDEEGIIREGILFDELIFEGEFNNIAQIITIDKTIKITGDDAVLNNIAFNIMADDVELNNMTFNANQEFMQNYGSIFLVTSNNITLINNKVNYTAPGTDSYVIYADVVKGLKIFNNDITFANEFHAKNIFANAIYLHDSSNVLMENNTMDITIPSVDIDYDFNNVFSEGVVVENCNDAIISGNDILVKYNSVIGNLDTLRAVNVDGSDNVVLANNTINAYGHKYVYGIVLDGNNFNLYNNTIATSSDINYANGININGPASGIVESNRVSAISPNASYPIYSSGYTGNVSASYVNNTIYGNANDVYGIYVSGTNENLTLNEVFLTGNFTIGIASYSTNTVMTNNTIHSLASNMGKAWNLDIIPCITSGITSINGTSIVNGNIIETTGNYSVDIFDGEVTNNYLIANTTCGDNSVKSNASILIENNTPLMKTANLTVNNVSLNVGDEIKFNVTLTDVDNNPLANYTVDLNVNGTDYQAVTDINGVATFEVDSLPAGVYEMEFIVDSENIVDLIMESALLNITLNNLNVTVTAEDICEGKDLVINVSVPDNLEKDLEIRINNSTYLIKKSGSIIISNLTAGKYLMTSYYPGDDYYNEYSDELNITVYEKAEIIVNINEPVEGEDLIIDVNGPKDITGNVTIAAGNQTFDVPFADGDANLTISNISQGFYPIVISYLGDEKYGPYAFEGNVTVNPKITPKENLTLEATADPITVGEDAVIVVTGFEDATGDVTVTVNGKTYAVPIKDGEVTVTVPGLVENATAVVTYDGDDNYNNASASVDIVVNPKPKENVTISIDAPAVEDGENVTVTVTLPEDATGSVTIGNDVVDVVNGTASAVLTGLPVGNTTVPISYSGDEKYNPIETDVNVTVNEKPVPPKENLTLEASANPITVGEDAVIVVVGFEDATGDVTVTVNGKTYAVPIKDGEVTVTVPGLVENATAVVTYDGDDNYNNASASVDIVVNPKPKENATISIDAPAVSEGENATITVTLPEDATGSVTIGNDVVDVVNGTASAVLTGLSVGNTTLPVTYSGDDKYNPIDTTVNVTVNEKPVPPKENLTISATADAIAVGEDAVIVVTGLKDATGDVTAEVGDAICTAPIVDGVATITVPGLVENATAVVTYDGDDKYNNASASVDIVVNPKPKENATISVDAPAVSEGENATVTVTLPEDATGSVTIGNEVIPVVNGTASAVLTDLPVGNTTVPISYSGDEKYNPIETSVNVTVNEKPVPPKENLTISATADAIAVGEDAVIVVSGLEDATGNVTAEVCDGIYTAPIVDGVATITVSGLVENATATITYAGDDNYNNASTTVDIVVSPKPKENATYSIDAPEVTEGENATVTVTLPEDATGTVTVGNETVPVENGTATVTIADLPAGNTTLPVTYSGDDKYNPIEDSVTITVKEDKSDIISAPDVVKYYKGPERFVVTVTDYEGTPLANKTVIININGRDYTRTTDENGTASMALGLPSNTYNVTVTVDNQTVKSVVTILFTVNGTDVVKMYRNGTQYYATFLDSEGKYLKDGTVVNFNINGVMYERKISGDKGLAKLNINLPEGEYIITAINPETTEMAANNITVLSSITENRDITKYYKNGTQYTVKVLGADGKAVGAGETVKFNINGVFYERKTNESGIAKLSINLPEGDYVITAEYNGCKVANNITVLPVLSAKDITMKYRDGTKFVATLLDGQGKPYAGQSVQFNINGVMYNRVTDDNGQAKLNINLMAGKYIITSSFNGANIANTITITA